MFLSSGCALSDSKRFTMVHPSPLRLPDSKAVVRQQAPSNVGKGLRPRRQRKQKHTEFYHVSFRVLSCIMKINQKPILINLETNIRFIMFSISGTLQSFSILHVFASSSNIFKHLLSFIPMTYCQSLEKAYDSDMLLVQPFWWLTAAIPQRKINLEALLLFLRVSRHPQLVLLWAADPGKWQQVKRL